MSSQNIGPHRVDKYWDRRIETISRDELRQSQADNIRKQLEYVYRLSSFYREKFARDKFHPMDFRSMGELQLIPMTRKNELREAISNSGNPLPHLCVSRENIAGFGCSRGTTGKPTFSAFTQEDIDLRVECYTRSFLQIGLKRKRLLHSMIGIQSITHFVLREAARRLGLGYISDGVDNLSNSVHIGRWLKPDALITGVRTLFEMEKILEAENHLPRDVFSYERIVLYGDVVGTHLVGHVRERWGAQHVFSLSGSAADLLWYNFDCDTHAGNHCLNEDMFLVEVIDPTNGHPVKNGEKGELVVTDLLSKGAPHIRWNLEDIVIPLYEPCECGRTHLRLKYLGRALYEINIEGKEVFPAEIELLLWSIKEVEGAEFRIVKYAREMDCLRLQVEVGQKQDQGLKARIGNHLEDRLGIDVEVEFVSPGELPVMDIKSHRVLDLTKP
jgi:phenylacetate-CoA ligase